MPSISTPDNRSAVIGIELDGDGAHPAAWRFSAHQPGTLLSGSRIRETVQAADTAGFHLATFHDSRTTDTEGAGVAGRIDAVQRAAFASAVTRSIGLVPEAGVLYTEPFHLATQLASLDYSSYGRAGWLATAENTVPEARSVGREYVPRRGGRGRGRRRRRSLTAAVGLLGGRRRHPRRATGRYLDADKLHYVDFEREEVFRQGSVDHSPPRAGAAASLPPLRCCRPSKRTWHWCRQRRRRTWRPLQTEPATPVRRARCWSWTWSWTPAASGPLTVSARAGLARAVDGWRQIRGDAAGLAELLAGLFKGGDGVRLSPRYWTWTCPSWQPWCCPIFAAPDCCPPASPARAP